LAVKFLYYFVIVFFGISLFLLFQKPYVIEKKENQNVPEIVMKNVQNFELTDFGVLSFLKSKIVRRYKTHDEFEDVSMLKKNPNGLIDSVSAQLGVLRNNDLLLKKDVRYDRSDGLSLESQEVFYNLKTKVLSSNVDFKLSNPRGVSYGSSFIYDTDKGIIQAQNIKASIKENDK
jgi:LPS export ABC transporter protein LptC